MPTVEMFRKTVSKILVAKEITKVLIGLILEKEQEASDIFLLHLMLVLNDIPTGKKLSEADCDLSYPMFCLVIIPL